MKESIFFSILFMCISFCTYSQQDKYDNLTSGKWQIKSVEIGNEVMDVRNEGHWMVFHSNGFYQMMLDNEEQVGTWKLDDKNQLKFDVENFNGESFISELSAEQLKFFISGYTLALTK